MWPAAMEAAVREGEIPSRRLCDTSLTDCRRCGEGEEGRIIGGRGGLKSSDRDCTYI